MTLEASLFSLLGPLVASRFYPDRPPDEPTLPCIVYQQVGGAAVDFLSQALPDKDNARMQVTVWSRTRAEASSLARQVRVALTGSALQVNTLGAPRSIVDDDLKLYGSRTDYSIWYTP